MRTMHSNLGTVLDVNIGTPKLLTIPILKFEQVNFVLLLVDVSKYWWMSGRQCRP